MTDTATLDPQVEDQAPALTEEEQAAEAALAAAKTEAQLAAFRAAAIAAVEDCDPSTGTIAEAGLEPVKVAYRAIEGQKARNQAKAFAAESMRGVLSGGDLTKVFQAVAWNAVQDALLIAAPKPAASTPKPTVSPDQLFADHVQALRLALDFAENAVPEGVTDEWEDKINSETDNLSVVEAYAQWLSTEVEKDDEDAVKAHADAEPEASAVVKLAVKLATSKGPRKAGRPAGTHIGPKRDVGVHISNAFDQVASGTFLTVSEIRNTKSAEYGDDAPSAGAINQRLRPPSGKPTTIPGITVGQNDDGTWGATKN